MDTLDFNKLDERSKVVKQRRNITPNPFTFIASLIFKAMEKILRTYLAKYSYILFTYCFIKRLYSIKEDSKISLFFIILEMLLKKL